VTAEVEFAAVTSLPSGVRLSTGKIEITFSADTIAAGELLRSIEPTVAGRVPILTFEQKVLLPSQTAFGEINLAWSLLQGAVLTTRPIPVGCGLVFALPSERSVCSISQSKCDR